MGRWKRKVIIAEFCNTESVCFLTGSGKASVKILIERIEDGSDKIRDGQPVCGRGTRNL